MKFGLRMKAAGVLIFCCFFLYASVISAQQQENKDSVEITLLLLREMAIEAFRNERTLSATPGAIGIISSAHLNSNDQTSLQNALNTVPGVIMESRGYGGSQRINIRGSFLRSPFAVRNIKMYMDGIPLSSPDGTAPLEVIDAFDIREMEVIKGPAGSIYGSGTGGVLLMKSQYIPRQLRVHHSAMMGSFGIKRFASSLDVPVSGRTSFRLSHIYQENEGYREQEFNRKQSVNLFVRSNLSRKHSLHFYGSYFNGHLALPGALTPAEVKKDPVQANAYSIANNASLYRERFFGGISHTWFAAEKWKLTTSAYGMYTQKYNPYGTAAAYTRNGYKDEMSAGGGGRVELSWYAIQKEKHALKVLAGGEIQSERFEGIEWTNRGGQPGNLKYNYDVNYLSALGFASLDYSWNQRLIVTASASSNALRHQIAATGFDATQLDSVAVLKAEFLPRLAVGYTLCEYAKPYASVSFGNSNPTVFEQVEIQQFGSATGFANSIGLLPEHGISYEAGLKGGRINALRYEANAYYFQLNDAILPYTTERLFGGTGNMEEFTLYSNAGSVIQRGMEASVFREMNFRQVKLEVWLNGQYTHYRFGEYEVGGTDYADKRMPGMPYSTISSGFSAAFWESRIVWSAQHYYFDRIPLNNANTDFSSAYHLVNSRLDLKWGSEKSRWRREEKAAHESSRGETEVRIFFGVNNVLNTKYTSFLQTNAVAQRYYNPSPERNYFVGIGLTFGK